MAAFQVITEGKQEATAKDLNAVTGITLGYQSPLVYYLDSVTSKPCVSDTRRQDPSVPGHSAIRLRSEFSCRAPPVRFNKPHLNSGTRPQ
jgi:hypothetical protein